MKRIWLTHLLWASVLAGVASVASPVGANGVDLDQRGRLTETILGFSGRNVADAIVDNVAARSFTGHHIYYTGESDDDTGSESGDGTGAAHLLGFTLWGGASARALNSASTPISSGGIAGESFQGYAGGDYHVKQNVYGVAVGASRTKLDIYSTVEGDVGARMDMISVHPYVTLELGGATEVWGTIGIASGNLYYDSVCVTDKRHEITDVSFRMVGGGFTQALRSVGAGALSLKLDFYSSTTTLAGRRRVFNEMRTTATRGRALFEVASRPALTKNPWTAAARTGVRYELGDGRSGFGFEMNAEVAFKDVSRGLAIRAQIGGLFFHTEQRYRHIDGGINIRIDPGIKGKGPKFGVYAQPVLYGDGGGVLAGGLHLQMDWRL